jgi:hypothetical protein
VQVSDACAAPLGYMIELVGEAGAGVDLEE